MREKILILLILLIFSMGCMAGELIRCPIPTHTKGSSWNAGTGWYLVSDGPDNDMTQVPPGSEVIRKFHVGWADRNSIICTYNFDDVTTQLIIKHDIGCARDLTGQRYSFGFRWSNYTCKTTVDRPEACMLDRCRKVFLNGPP